MESNTLKSILQAVEKPSRYSGDELNSIFKQPDTYDIHYAFCFPDVYEVGMSHLGTRILYSSLNSRDDCYCERCFAPWIDMHKRLEENDIKLFSLETKTPLYDFDFVGFTLQYEMSYTNIINMLKLGGIPIYSKDRDENCPIIIAGGPCAYSCEAIANFFDIIVLGEGEEINDIIIDIYKQMKSDGFKKLDILKKLSTYQGIYIPCLYDVKYVDSDFNEIIAADDAPSVVKKVIVADMNTAHWPEKPILPYLATIHDRVTLEIFRGCTRGCRFCQAGMIYRPVREKTVETLICQAQNNLDATGYEEVSLSSLSSGDYSNIKDLVLGLVEVNTDCHTTISLPSLRLDAYGEEYMKILDSQRKSVFTLAPEAGTQRLRDVINKGVTKEDLKKSVRTAYEHGFESVKLYFMLGLPTETYEDIDGIAILASIVKEEYFNVPKEKRSRRPRISVSASCFVPKAYTPFQWVKQDSLKEFKEKQKYLKQKLRMIKGIDFSYHDPKVSQIEAVFARGDRQLDKVIVRACELGCRFDGWSEFFDYSKWVQAFSDCRIEIEKYTKAIDMNTVLPWDHTNPCIEKSFLIREYELSLKGKTTLDCREKCNICGVNKIKDINTCNKC